MANKYVGKRIFYYDALRAIAILAIILCHTTEIFGNSNYSSLKLAIPAFLNIIGLVGVPLFFMLSGALLLNRDYDLSEFFKKRFSRIVYPAIFWMAITIALFYFIYPSYNFSGLIFGEGKYTWFIWVMVGLYLIIPVINSFVKDYKLKGCEYFILIWLVTCILTTIGKYPFKRLELSYFAGYLGYIVLGYYLANKDFKISDLSLGILGFILYVVFTLTVMFIRYNHLGILSNYESIFVVVLSAWMFLFVRSLNTILEEKSSQTYQRIKNGTFGDAIFWLSAASYGMYFAHIIFITFARFHKHYPLKMLPILYVIIVALSLFTVAAVNKIPFLQKFSGMS